MRDIDCKLLVIGAGPGGYVCAARAAELGLDTIIVENRRMGGTCLNVGCIPSKALIHAADEFERASAFAAGGGIGVSTGPATLDLKAVMGWKDAVVGRLNAGVAGLLKSAGVKTLDGTARFRDGKTVEVATPTGLQVVRAEAIVIAAGSAPVELPALPFGGDVLSSTEALALTALPERLAVVGAGYIGLEIGTAYAKLGSKVTVVEAADRILPQYDAELTRPVAQRLKALGVETFVGAKALGRAQGALLVETGEGDERRIQADKILATVGRRPLTDGWGLEELALEMDGRAVRIDERCRTSMRGVYAIGDVAGEPMLAHRAMAQGEMVAEIVAGRKRAWDKRCIPAICFTDPEIVTAGQSPETARAAGADVRVARTPFRANGRALTAGRDDGFVRVVARADTGLVLGLQAVGPGVAELAAAFATAIEMCATVDDLAGTVFAHPTRGEALHEAATELARHGLEPQA